MPFGPVVTSLYKIFLHLEVYAKHNALFLPRGLMLPHTEPVVVLDSQWFDQFLFLWAAIVINNRALYTPTLSHWSKKLNAHRKHHYLSQLCNPSFLRNINTAVYNVLASVVQSKVRILLWESIKIFWAFPWPNDSGCLIITNHAQTWFCVNLGRTQLTLL